MTAVVTLSSASSVQTDDVSDKEQANICKSCEQLTCMELVLTSRSRATLVSTDTKLVLAAEKCSSSTDTLQRRDKKVVRTEPDKRLVTSKAEAGCVGWTLASGWAGQF